MTANGLDPGSALGPLGRAVSSSLGSKGLLLVHSLGVVVVVVGIAEWLWTARRGGERGHNKKLAAAIALGVLLAAPAQVMSSAFHLIDVLARAVLSLVGL